MQHLVILLAFLVAVSCAGSGSDSCRGGAPEQIPLAALLVHPSRYHGCHVDVVGFVIADFELPVMSMYLSEGHARAMDSPSSIWLDLDEKVAAPEEAFQTVGWAQVHGIFDARRAGHMGVVPAGRLSVEGFWPRDVPAR